MKTLLDVDTTATLNSRVGLDGEMAIDNEKKAVRYFDGQTSGGFEASLVRAYIPPVGPGPIDPIAGNTALGYYGLVDSADVITGSALAAAVGLSEGVLIHDTTPWMKFALNGKVLFIPQKPLRHSMSWNTLYQLGLVYGVDGGGADPYNDVPVNQNVTINIETWTLKVRLMTGSDTDPASGAGGEWNELMYRVSGDSLGEWEIFTTSQLYIWQSDAKYNYVQETGLNFSTNAHVRGSMGVESYGEWAKSSTSWHSGWRPVLEVVP